MAACHRQAVGHPKASHDPISVRSWLGLLHRPEAILDHDTGRFPLSGRLVEPIAAGMGSLETVVEGSHESPELPAVRQEDPVADTKIACTRVDDDWSFPGRAAVLTDPHMGLLRGGVLAPLVEAVGRVKLALVPRQANAEGPVAAIGVGPPRLDDVEGHIIQHGGFGGFGEDCGWIPERHRLSQQLPCKAGDEREEKEEVFQVHDRQISRGLKWVS